MTDRDALRHDAMMIVVHALHSVPQLGAEDVLGDVVAFLATMRARPADFVQGIRNRAMSSLIIDGIIAPSAVRYAAAEDDDANRRTDDPHARARLATLHVLGTELDALSRKLREALLPPT